MVGSLLARLLAFTMLSLSSLPALLALRSSVRNGAGAGDGLAQTAVSELNISLKAILLDGQSVVAQKVRCMLQL